MAYVSKETKAALAPAIKAVLKKYGVKGTIAVGNHSSLVVNIKSGDLDLIGDANKFNKVYFERGRGLYYELSGNYQVNPYYTGPEYSFDPKVGEFFAELVAAMKGNRWYDNSDIMTDYFDTAYYLNINVGKWDKPYVCTANIAVA